MKATKDLKVLVTGFGPFKDVEVNPSQYLAENSGESHEVLEVAYQAAEELVYRLDPGSFDVWLMLGVAAGRKKICLELYARNSKKGKDVRGVELPGIIDNTAPLLLSSTLWSPELTAELLCAESDHVQSSMDAGAYLCNFLLFKGLVMFPEKRIGFMHVVMPEAISLEKQSQVVARALDEIRKEH